MEISGMNQVVQAVPNTVAIPREASAARREVIQAVKAVNSSNLLGEENQLTFQQDAATHRVVVKLVNRKTGDVVVQMPSEEVLRLAQDLKNQGR